LLFFFYTATTNPLASQVSAVAVAQSLELVSNGHVELGQPLVFLLKKMRQESIEVF
jgi:hypothetical protein